MTLIVATERLGLPDPPTGWRRLIPWETQHRLVYADDPGQPTATCHLQRAAQEPALCGHPWELLVVIPGGPAWTDLHPEMRCARCSKAADMPKEDSANRGYRFTWRDV